MVFLNPFGEMKIATSEIDRCPSHRAINVIAKKVLANQDYFIAVEAKCLSPEPLA